MKPVPRIPDFPSIERGVLERWREHGVFDALRRQNAEGERWSFLDGPITANNPMGVHHAWGRSYKDIFQRYHAMLGRHQRYQNGFDCQGLWVEVEVEKQLGFRDKNDIVAYGIDRFVDRCKERVLRFAAQQTEQSIRLGYWMDWDDPDTLRALADALHESAKSVEIITPSGETIRGTPAEVIGQLGSQGLGGSYFTLSNENNYTIWAFLKKCADEGHLYRGTDVMPWCTRCGTGLSQMETSEGRKITRHTSVFVRFPIREREREALLVWTTTPWTLTSNVAAAVNPASTYLKLRHGDWILYVGKGNYEHARVQELEAGGQRERHVLQGLSSVLSGSAETEILAELPGRELVGLSYDGPFDHLAAQQRPGGLSIAGVQAATEQSGVQAHRVVAWQEVQETEGTGIVHVAPGCGAEDNRLGRSEALPIIAPLDEGGIYVDGFGEWTGRHVRDVTDDLVADLRARGLLLAKESYPHVYPHCWRCKQELVFRLVDEWFIRMDWRDRIQRIVPDIRWIPPDGEAREMDWLRNMGDWMISKKRFWGLALPIWVCGACDQFTVIGSRAELEERATAGLDQLAGHSPHRPWIDAVEIACLHCGGTAHRIKDVGNPWLDAGIVPFSTMYWRTDPDYWKQWFPADFVVECFPGQFRNWFYSLLAMSVMMTDQAPFRVLLGHALARDERGVDMHKSAGNAIAFDDAADKLGAEIMRYLFASQNPTQNLNFPDLPDEGGEKPGQIASQVRRKLLTWWNCYSFLVTYALAEGWRPPIQGQPAAHASFTEMDRWLVSQLQHLVVAARESFADFALFRFVDRFESFVENLSNWWLRRSRARFWAEDGSDKEAAFQTLYTVLDTLNRLMAPILPFLVEHMHDNLVRSNDAAAPVSIHLLPYPQPDPSRIDAALERRFEVIMRVRNLGLQLRNVANLRIRQPLGVLLVRPAGEFEREVLASGEHARHILEECNVKELRLLSPADTLETRTLKPNFKTLGRKLGKHMAAAKAVIEEADPASLEHGGTIEVDGETFTLTAEDVIVTTSAPEHLVSAVDHDTFVALDTRITPELLTEGIVRDLNRFIQNMRKDLELAVTQRIVVRYAAPDATAWIVEAHAAELKAALLCEQLVRVDALPGGESRSLGSETIQFEIEPWPLLEG